MPKTKPGQEDGGVRIQSIEAGMEVLQVLTRARGPMSLTALAAQSGMTSSRVHKYLQSFLRVGLVVQSARGQYDIGQMAMELGFAALERMDVVNVAQEYLDNLSDELNYSSALSVWADGGPVIVRSSQSNEPISLFVQLGQQLPLLNSASGLVFAAYVDPAIVEKIVSKEIADANGSEANSIVNYRDVESVLSRTRDTGLGIVEGTMTLGVNAIAAPIFDYRDSIVAAIAILGLKHRLPADPECKAAKILRARAFDFSCHLGQKR